MEGSYFPARAGLVASHFPDFDLYDSSCDLLTCLFLLQILEVPVTARDVEREHHAQLKRWKKNRGELNFKPPPRMHGARLIMLSEPPRRQDLQQNPTIVLEVPQPTLKKGKEEKKSKKKKSVKKSQPVVEIPNPYPLPNDPPPPPSDPLPNNNPPPLASDPLPNDPPPPSSDPLPNNLPLPPSDPPAPPPVRDETAETVPQTESDSPHQQQAPPTDLPPAKESPLQRSTQSLSSTEQDTYL